jgi:hypothetical protein
VNSEYPYFYIALVIAVYIAYTLGRELESRRGEESRSLRVRIDKEPDPLERKKLLYQWYEISGGSNQLNDAAREAIFGGSVNSLAVTSRFFGNLWKISGIFAGYFLIRNSVENFSQYYFLAALGVAILFKVLSGIYRKKSYKLALEQPHEKQQW